MFEPSKSRCEYGLTPIRQTCFRTVTIWTIHCEALQTYDYSLRLIKLQIQLWNEILWVHKWLFLVRFILFRTSWNLTLPVRMSGIALRVFGTSDFKCRDVLGADWVYLDLWKLRENEAGRIKVIRVFPGCTWIYESSGKNEAGRIKVIRVLPVMSSILPSREQQCFQLV